MIFGIEITMFKYLVVIALILGLWIMAQRGCKSFGERFHERQQERFKHRQERWDKWREQRQQKQEGEERRRIFDGFFYDRFRKRQE